MDLKIFVNSMFMKLYDKIENLLEIGKYFKNLNENFRIEK